MSPQTPGRDDSTGARSDSSSSSGSRPSRPVVTGTAAARYNAPRETRTPPTEAERTQTLPAQPDGPASSSSSSGRATSGAGSSSSSSSGSGSAGASSASSSSSDQPPWQRGRGTAVVDAPTSSIKRTDVPTDMPDLSTPRSSRPRPETPRPERDPSPAPEPVRRSSTARASRKGPRRASLQLKHIDPWSTLKLSLVLSVAMFLVWMVAVGVLYLVLDSMGVWERLNSTFSEFVTSSDPTASAAPLVGPGRIFGIAAVIGAVNIVLLTALATIGSFIYNLSSDLAGGIEVTLTERD